MPRPKSPSFPAGVPQLPYPYPAYNSHQAAIAKLQSLADVFNRDGDKEAAQKLLVLAWGLSEHSRDLARGEAPKLAHELRNKYIGVLADLIHSALSI